MSTVIKFLQNLSTLLTMENFIFLIILYFVLAITAILGMFDSSHKELYFLIGKSLAVFTLVIVVTGLYKEYKAVKGKK